MSITYKALALLVIPAVTLCGAVYYAAQTAGTAMQHSVQRAAQARAEAIMDEIDREIHNRIAEWLAFGRTRLVQQTLEASNKEIAARSDQTAWIRKTDAEWIKSLPSKTIPIVHSIQSNELSKDLRQRVAKLNEGFQNPVYGEVFFTNKYGVNAAQSQTTTDFWQSDEEWWKAAESKGVSINDVGYDQSAEVYSVDLGLRIDNESSAMIGVAKIVLNLQSITELIDARGIGGRGSPVTLTLLSSKNQIIRTTTDPAKPLADGALLLTGIDLGQDSPVFSTVRMNPVTREEVVTAVARSRGFGRNPGLQWTLLLDQQASVALAPLDYVKRHVIFTMTIGLSVSILLSGLIVRGVVKRIRLLEAAAQRVGNGEYGLSVLVAGRDEIGRLGDSFNKMSSNLAESSSSLAVGSPGTELEFAL